jgi:N-methylhydantoinase B
LFQLQVENDARISSSRPAFDALSFVRKSASTQVMTQFDSISLNIHWTRLVSMVDEAAATFRRTCFSTLVREANDFAVILTDALGNSLAQSSMSIPSFIGTLPATVKHMLAEYPAKTLKPGDFLFTNDPWLGTGHVYDVSGVCPLFHDNQLVGFAAVASHVPDIGGRIWGTGAREIYEEGLQIPPMKLVHAGVTDASVVKIICQNVRVPELTMGDLWGQVAACHMLQERLTIFLDETGVALDALGQEVRRRSRSAMQAAIKAVPDGRYHETVYQDGFDAPIKINCSIEVSGDKMSIDYTGSSEQLPRAVNVVPAYTFAYSAYAVKCLLEPELPNNEGSFAPLRTSAPLGCVLNPKYPAASGARHIVGQMVVPAIIGALTPALPERSRAQGSGSASFTLTGEHDAARFSSVNFMTAGQGASADSEGYSTLSFPSNVGNTPIEVLEAGAPVLVKARQKRPRSGGLGAKRGGDGGKFVFEYRGKETALVTFQVRCQEFAPRGAQGGGNGAKARLRLNGKAIDASENHALRYGDVVNLETAGGGGFGGEK